jgi:hypothetical protein
MENKQLDHLMTYTVFHIGVYVSLSGALIGAGIFGTLDHLIIRWAVGCFLAASIFGAAVGSNIPEHKDFASYSSAKIGFWGLRPCTFRVWAFLEHFAFWLGILPIAVGFVVYGPSAFRPH